MRAAILLPWLILLSACRSGSAGHAADLGAPAQPAASRLAPPAIDTLARIHALTANPACSTDSQCHSLALGASPCGGPEHYLVWSSTRTPKDELQALAQIYQAERRAANQASGKVGACRLLPDPGAVCRAGLCEPGAGMPALR